MKYTLEYEADGVTYLEEVTLPSKFVVCGRCEGRGVHDCWEGGMTGDEMAEQGPEFFDDYMDGVYDTRCTECNGLRVIEAINVERVPPALMGKFVESEKRRQEYESELYYERQMAARGVQW